jgi:hypothetical protein
VKACRRPLKATDGPQELGESERPVVAGAKVQGMGERGFREGVSLAILRDQVAGLSSVDRPIFRFDDGCHSNDRILLFERRAFLSFSASRPRYVIAYKNWQLIRPGARYVIAPCYR